MTHYMDIRLRPDPEFPEMFLLRALYSKLHRALFDLSAQDIGVSFPQHRTGVKARTLGAHLRLHGGKERLEALMQTGWLSGMRDHVTLTDIEPVPEDAQHITVKRRQFNTGSESRAKRYAKRHSVSVEEARQMYQKVASRKIELPYVQLASRSTQEQFCLFIEHGKPQEKPAGGQFNHYGLSQGATVPWF
ncbi:type I-F CRISPR-associated endoribonuclease Cas6/Csy4 [Halomonas piscis]|uniref:type I-F CRISPR-associated endoribonuclease Cas6/Csy4 n=1 Tax=Halomonas piscis TaxID=3031727 RepID=UPI00289C8960|nr:type I-F CRISPR-associated endoribonuclease Cas6/Csy4 [Halomonas piscis]